MLSCNPPNRGWCGIVAFITDTWLVARSFDDTVPGRLGLHKEVTATPGSLATELEKRGFVLLKTPTRTPRRDDLTRSVQWAARPMNTSPCPSRFQSPKQTYLVGSPCHLSEGGKLNIDHLLASCYPGVRREDIRLDPTHCKMTGAGVWRKHLLYQSELVARAGDSGPRTKGRSLRQDRHQHEKSLHRA